MRRNEDCAFLAEVLKSTLIYTADKDMMRFTEQWYNETESEKAKASLMPALVISKLMSGGDCTGWLRDFLSAKGTINGKEAAAVTKEAVASVMEHIEPCADGFEFVVRHADIFDEWLKFCRHIDQPMDKITDVLIDNADDKIIEKLGDWAISAEQKNIGEKLRQRLGDYFSKLVLEKPENKMIITYLRCCGRKDFRGLTTIYCEKMKDTVNFDKVTSYIIYMFMPEEETIEEIMDVVKKLRSGELKCKDLSPDQLEKWARTRWGME